MSADVKKAMATITKAIKEDSGYACGWHCNIAMAAYDAGATIEVANEGAARFMQLCFNTNTRQFCGQVIEAREGFVENVKHLTDEQLVELLNKSRVLNPMVNEMARRLARKKKRGVRKFFKSMLDKLRRRA